MFSKTISHSDDQAQTIASHTKRTHARRQDDCCVVIVNGQMHPVENWSSGGLLMTADERLYSKEQDCVFTMKFKLRDEISEIDHKATVVRKSPNKVALQFLPLTKAVQSSFQKVIDDFVAQRFAESQVDA